MSKDRAKDICRHSKEEIALKPLFSHKDKLAFLSALIISSGSLVIHGESVAVTLSTANDNLSDAVKRLAEELTGKECLCDKKNKRNEIVIGNAIKLLCQCGILEVEDGVSVCEHIPEKFTEEQSAAAYVRGAYLGAGSFTASKYHLEFSFGRKSIAEDFAALLGKFGISAKFAVRNTRAVVYAKDSESISDCLALMGAAKAVLEFNSIIAERQMNEHLNRQQNCDMYNIDRQIETGLTQCAYIKELDLNELSPSLKSAAMLRLEYPDYSYEQLSAMLGISKSGLKNRFRRLKELYDKKCGNGT